MIFCSTGQGQITDTSGHGNSACSKITVLPTSPGAQHACATHGGGYVILFQHYHMQHHAIHHNELPQGNLLPTTPTQWALKFARQGPLQLLHICSSREAGEPSGPVHGVGLTAQAPESNASLATDASCTRQGVLKARHLPPHCLTGRHNSYDLDKLLAFDSVLARMRRLALCTGRTSL